MVNLKTAFVDVVFNKCSNEIINMTQILALTGGGGNGGKKKRDVLFAYLSHAHRRKQAWMLQPGLRISKQRGAAVHLPPEFHLSFG